MANLTMPSAPPRVYLALVARFRSAVALVLLAALAAGGTVAPLVHGALHAEETARTQTHLADGHHHHEADDHHGREALPPCPEPLDAHLTCVLFATGAAVALAEAPIARTTDPVRLGTEVDAPGPRDQIAHGARGPPAIA